MSNKQNQEGILLIVLATVCLVLSSGCGGNASAASIGGSGDSPSLEDLQDFLFSEFERLGVDPSKTGSQAPTGSGNAVFDLSAILVDPDGEGPDEPTGIELSWTEQLIGDFDQNGEVNLSDLTPIVLNYQAQVEYDSADLHGGIAYWPSGDPDGLGAANWRLARIDGDQNGEINVSDITSIVQHWGERLDGYTVYKNGPADAEYSALPNGADPESLLTIPRSSTYAPGSNSPDPSKPVRYHHTVDLEGFGLYDFQIGGLDSVEGIEGSLSHSQSFNYNEPPVADLAVSPDHGGIPLPVTFDASGSVDNDGEIVLYEWDFDGDGTFDSDTTEPTTEHTYEGAGTFEAVVQVTDDQGGTDSASTAIEVFGSEPPVVYLTAMPTAGNAPLYVGFDASESSDPGGEQLSFEWDLDGDGEFGDLVDPDPLSPFAQYVYLDAGTVIASVKCTNESGAWETASIEISVAPVADGLYIAPDPTDIDWLDVAGAGTDADPYVVADVGFNEDYSVEFSLVVFEYSGGSWTDVNPAELEWISFPPFAIDWVSDGVFMANLFTGDYLFAQRLAPEGVSNSIYVVTHLLPDS